MHFNSRRRISLAIAACVVIAAAAAAFWLLPPHQPVPKRQIPTHPPNAATDEITLSGKIEPQHTVDIAAPISGRVEETHGEPGQEVHEGDLLAIIRSVAADANATASQTALREAEEALQKLDSEILSARLEVSRARSDASRAGTEFQRAQKMYERQKMLVGEGATPRLVYEKAEKEFLAAQADWNSVDEVARAAQARLDALEGKRDAAQKRVDDARSEQDSAKADSNAGEVRSPINGVILARRAEPGTEVDPSLRDLFRIGTDLNLLRVVANLIEKAAFGIHAGQNAVVYVAEAGGQPFPGVVSSAGDGHVVVDFVSADPAVKPGLTAQVKIRLQ